MNLGAPEHPSSIRLGPIEPLSPVVLSVPHAGRDYPAALLAATRVRRDDLVTLEDRYADRLVETAVAQGASAIVARRARAWIDLNRDEREIDPAMVSPPPPGPLVASAKVRGGLGLVPRRIAGAGEILRGPIAATDLAARIRIDHRPWHDALDASLRAARARFGVAVLLDVHSMPPTPGHGIVVGDRHGASASARFVARIEAEAAAAGIAVARNEPYAGGYTAQRHGRPAHDVHAIQLEVDRSLYLEHDLRTPSPGLPRIAALIAAIIAALADEALRSAATLLAAE